jgi:hypothetical protein
MLKERIASLNENLSTKTYKNHARGGDLEEVIGARVLYSMIFCSYVVKKERFSK